MRNNDQQTKKSLLGKTTTMKIGSKSIRWIMFLLVGMLSFSTYGQSKKQKAKILEATDVNKLTLLKEQFATENQAKKAKALEMAQRKGWVVQQVLPDGRFMELQEISKSGKPMYYYTENIEAAATTAASRVWPGGGAGLDLTGAGMIVGEWDGGAVRPTHQEFTNNRLVQRDAAVFVDNDNTDHATHVGGTMVAEGINPNAKGMAYEATLWAHDWNSDEEEMAAAAAEGLLMSNHSYGFRRGWAVNATGTAWEWLGDASISSTEDYGFGFYDEQAKDWDDIAYNAPYYLIVKSAGNDRGNGPANAGTGGLAERDGGDDGYDCIGHAGLGKNILTVGAVNPIPNGYTDPSEVVISSFSSFGPTDDGRIKPDIVGNGVGVFSAGSAGDASYTTKSGTSMSSPNVTGSMTLLQEHYSETHGGDFMKAATLKALVLHTADEAGTSEGPDYVFGWGLMNTETATEVITNDGVTSMIADTVINDGETATFSFSSTGNEPLDVTIVWNDLSGTPVAPSLNPTDLMLVNDLDMRLDKNGTVFSPYILDPANKSAAATTGDNFRDNVERIHIENPTSGGYVLTVNHKGTLVGGSQRFSIVVSGTSVCTSTATDDANSIISKVEIGSIATATDNTCAVYTDFSSISTDVRAGDIIPFTVGMGTCGAENDRIAKIFIDWNGDSDFEDANETVATSGVFSTSGDFTGNITVPASGIAFDRIVAMRIVLVETTDASMISECGEYVFGETEDYVINIIPPVPTITSFTPLAGPVGTDVSVLGDNFDYVETVTLAGNAIDFTRVNDETITFIVPIGASSGKISVTNSYDNAESILDFTVEATPAPLITSFTPTSGSPDEEVTIMGDFFTEATSVKFNGVEATDFSIINDGELLAIVPNGSSTGKISVTNVTGTTESATDFIYIDAANMSEDDLTTCEILYRDPQGNDDYAVDQDITQTIYPATASSLIKVDFTEFDLESGTNQAGDPYDFLTIYDGTTKSASTLIGTYYGSTLPPSITATNPDGAITFHFSSDESVFEAGWKANISCYELQAPTITSFTPTSSFANTEIEISGTDFIRVTGVSFNGTAATDYEVVNANTINVTVPAGGSTGKISVTNEEGTAMSATDFTYIEAVLMSSDDVTTCNSRYLDAQASDNYLDNSNITQTIYPATEGSLIQIDFQEFNMETNSDYLYIYDGISTDATRIGIYTGTSLPPTVYATNPAGAITFWFVSDGSTNESGFDATISCYTLPAPTVTSFTPAMGYVGTEVTITGTDFTNVDNVLFNGVPALSFSTVNTETIRALAPVGTSGKITLVTERGNGESATDYTYQEALLMANGSSTVCDMLFMDSYGKADYAINENLVHVVYPATDGKVVQVNFSAFFTEENSDALEVFDGNSVNAPLLGTFSGNAIPPTLTATTQEGALTFRFISNGTVVRSGWEANLSCVNIPTVSNFAISVDEDTEFRFSDEFETNTQNADSIMVASLPAEGTLKHDGDNVTVNQRMSLVEALDMTYQGVANWNGTTSFTYMAMNTIGMSDSEGTITITVNPVNDAPTISDISAMSLCKSSSSTIDLDGLVTDVDDETVDMNNYTFSFTVSSNTLDTDDLTVTMTGTEVTVTNNSSTAGTYSVEVKATEGTEIATSSFNVEAFQSVFSATINGDDITAPAGTDYQWSLGGTPITGATAQTYTATEVGDYTVSFTAENGCDVTSEVASITVITGIDFNDISNSLNIFPNPTSGILNLTMENKLLGKFSLRVIDASGKEVITSSFSKEDATLSRSLDMSKFPSGLYLLEVVNADSRGMIRLMKE